MFGIDSKSGRVYKILDISDPNVFIVQDLETSEKNICGRDYIIPVVREDQIQ